MPTQEEVDAQRDRVAELREKVRDQEVERSLDVEERNRQVQMDRLKAEEQRLEAQINKDTPASEPLRPSPPPATRTAERPMRTASDEQSDGGGEGNSNE